MQEGSGASGGEVRGRLAEDAPKVRVRLGRLPASHGPQPAHLEPTESGSRAPWKSDPSTMELLSGERERAPSCVRHWPPLSPAKRLGQALSTPDGGLKKHTPSWGPPPACTQVLDVSPARP